VRILVVDDDRAVREGLDRVLRRDGFEVVLAGDGESARSALASWPPGAVVLDLLLPDSDGVEICRALRRVGDRTPVLMLTARDAIADRVAGRGAGADDYLVKPFALDELRARARGTAARQSRRRGRAAALRQRRARPAGL
jgi:two-component system, OmpR family, response regulator MprA